MILDKLYEVWVNGEVQKFRTNLTEREFYHTLDAVYGKDMYSIVCVEYVD